jgi:hypothetical protein
VREHDGVGVLGVPNAQQRQRGRVRDAPRWWQGRQGHNRMIVAAVAVVGLLAILWGAVGKLTDGDQRVVVVNVRQGITNADRQQLKDDCGGLPGVRVVEDRGAEDLQYRFPVRFAVGGVDDVELSALYTCIDGHSDTMLGPYVEGDSTG